MLLLVMETNHSPRFPGRHDCKTVSISNPFFDPKSIATHGKKQPSVYIFKDLVTGAAYVGGAVNLYARVTSYFMPSIIAKGERRVYRYLKQYG